MVMDNIIDIRNVQTTGSYICTHKHRRRTIAELVQIVFALALVESAMVNAAHKSFFLKETIGSLHTIAIVQKYNTAFFAKTQQQAIKCFKFIFLLGLDHKTFYAVRHSDS